LHSVVVVVGDEDVVGPIDCNSDREVKLARLAPLFPPFPLEPNRLLLSVFISQRDRLATQARRKKNNTPTVHAEAHASSLRGVDRISKLQNMAIDSQGAEFPS